MMSMTMNPSHDRRSTIATHTARGITPAIAVVLASAGLLFLMLAAGKWMGDLTL